MCESSRGRGGGVAAPCEAAAALEAVALQEAAQGGYGENRAIADQLRERGVKLALDRALYDPADPIGKMFFNFLATFAEFEADLIRMRTREGMAIAHARGKLSDKRQRELCRMHATGDYSISDLAGLFSVSRQTVYRTLNRRRPPTAHGVAVSCYCLANENAPAIPLCSKMPPASSWFGP